MTLETLTGVDPLRFTHLLSGDFMADSNSSASSGGIGVLGLLGVVFVTLKLCGVIDWSWWWVTAPFWGGFALLLVILAIIGVGAGAVMLYEKATSR